MDVFLAAVLVVLLSVLLMKAESEETYGYTEDQLMKYTTVLGAPYPSVPAVFAPSSAYMLPQQGMIPGSPWATVSKSLKYPTVSFANNNLDWRQLASSTCASYNTPIAPRSQQDCPDSSFAFMTDMSRFIPGAKYAGCIQTGHSSEPWCHSKPDGTYEPWWERIAANSP